MISGRMCVWIPLVLTTVFGYGKIEFLVMLSIDIVQRDGIRKYLWKQSPEGVLSKTYF